MNDGSLKTLFHPFEAGLLDAPGRDGRVLFLNAAPGFRLPEGFPAAVLLQQGFRPDFLALERSGHQPVPEADGKDYDLTLLLCGRHRAENELWIAEALARTRPGGQIVVAGGKTDGAASLRKRAASLMTLDDHASKNHGVVFWLTRPPEVDAAVAALEAANAPLELEGGFRTVAGGFSQEHVDAGSLLLAQNLPDGLKGNAADFGAGWGYLSVQLARQGSKVTAIDLYEAGFASCASAKANMAALAAHVDCRVLWYDLLSERVERRYDVIIMNPPFHHGRAAETSIGAGMIRAASNGLKPGGKLFLVANRFLPYEPVLQTGFSRHGELCRDERFKVLWAVR